MLTRHIDNRSTDPCTLVEAANVYLNKLDIGSGQDDPPVAFLIQPTGEFVEGLAELKITIFEGFKSEVEIAESLLPEDYGARD